MKPETDPKNEITFSSLARPKASFEIVSQITGAIAEGRWAPGAQLPPEQTLMELFGVGRNTVREAIKILEVFGLVVIRRGEGTFVQDTCGIDLLVPVFISLLWLRPTQRELGEYFRILERVQRTFEDVELSDPRAEDRRARERKVRLGIRNEPMIADAVQSMGLAEDEGQEDLLEVLIQISRFLFGRYFYDFRGLGAEPGDLRQLYRISQGGLLSSEQMAAYLHGFSVCLEDRLRARGELMTRGKQAAHSALWHGREKTGFRPVFWSIVQDLVDGTCQPGDRLPTEAEFAERFQVGRSLVREALKGLEAMGVVEVQKPRGTFVARENQGLPAFVNQKTYGQIMAHQDLKTLLTFKAAIRDAVIYLACENADQEERQEFFRRTEVFAQALTAEEPDVARCNQALEELNEQLGAMCRNPILQQVERSVNRIVDNPRRRFIQCAIWEGRQEEVAQAYRADAAAVCSRENLEMDTALHGVLDLWTDIRPKPDEAYCANGAPDGETARPFISE